MSITVEQFIAQSQNIEFKCVAGFGGLGREVSSFSIVDTPEILSWLKGGELVVEAGYISKNFPALRENLVRDLAEKGCAGLGVKLNRYYNKLPDEFIEQGDKYDFPIFELPYETRFCDVAFEIHNKALAEALNNGSIAGAGIDVFDMEPPLPSDYPLTSAKNCVLTPHVGFLTNEAMEKRAAIVAANLKSFREGRPINTV